MYLTLQARKACFCAELPNFSNYRGTGGSLTFNCKLRKIVSGRSVRSSQSRES